MELSKIEERIKKEQRQGYLNDEVKFITCKCLHCINDTRPIRYPDPETLHCPQQYKYSSVDGYIYILQKLGNFKGRTYIPDTILTAQNHLYYSQDSGRVKLKDKQTNLDVIKHFDEKKKKIGTKHFSRDLNSTSNRYDKGNDREVAVVVFKDGGMQMLNDILLNKSLTMRKNDKEWLDIVMISLLPPVKKNPMEYTVYHYRATQSNRVQMLAIMQEIAQELDYQDQKFNFKNLQPTNSSQILEMSIGLSISSSKFFPKSLIYLSSQEMIKKVVWQLVAYLEVTAKVRIHNVILSYAIDPQDKYYLMIVQNLVAYELQNKDLRMVHDRYQTLDSIGEQELQLICNTITNKEEQTLWSICAKNVEICLNNRKIQLGIKEYQRPTQQSLRKIFSKIIPEFNPKDFFENTNWQNQLPVFLKLARQRINRIIRQDQGIRILRRFNISFCRTFD